MAAIEAENIRYSYQFAENSITALNGLSMTIEEGEFVAILGGNGSGKSTLAKHFNVLLPLQKGKLTIAGLDAENKSRLWQIRRKCGMIFQNPDNQFVSSMVEEDIAFGLENYETPLVKIPEKVKQALRLVGMEGSEKKSTHMLSGGQKQKIALAGVLAINPDIIIFDEATAMLDPEGRLEVLAVIRQLHKDLHKTIIMISHYIEEAVFSDRIYVMNDGAVLGCGTPREVLTDRELLERAGLKPPTAVQVYYDLKYEGIELGGCPLTNEELVDKLCQLY